MTSRAARAARAAATVWSPAIDWPVGNDRSPHRLALADDHGIVRSAIAGLVRSFSDMTVVAEAADGTTLLAALADAPADIAVVDLAMPGRDGFTTIGDLARTHPGVRRLVLSMYTSPEYIRRAREVGAHGFVAKHADAGEFGDAIRRVARRERFVVAPAGLENAHAHAPPGPGGEPRPELTRRQREVLRLVVDGLRTRDIAGRLGVSVKTIETHRADLMDRLAARNMAELVREALRLDLVADDH